MNDGCWLVGRLVVCLFFCLFASLLLWLFLCFCISLTFMRLCCSLGSLSLFVPAPHEAERPAALTLIKTVTKLVGAFVLFVCLAVAYVRVVDVCRVAGGFVTGAQQ